MVRVLCSFIRVDIDGRPIRFGQFARIWQFTCDVSGFLAKVNRIA
jgi:hypothetical protein